MGMLNGGGWSGAHGISSAWGSRGSCSREHMRYSADCRQMKVIFNDDSATDQLFFFSYWCVLSKIFQGSQLPAQNAMCQEGRSTPYPVYEDASSYNRAGTPRHVNSAEYNAAPQDTARTTRERFYPEPKRSPPIEKRPPVVPLPAFQQAFGSTEIGKFAEAFSRTEVAQDDTSADNFLFESFSEWDGPTDPQWAPQTAGRDVKCEDNYWCCLPSSPN